MKKTIIVFSGDLDKAMAAFVIANGAAAMGDDVTMFFTFWGLNIIRRPEKVPAKKGFLQAMFGRMMPRGADRLGLSKMNFGGMGASMMKMVMKQQKVASLPELMETARDQGIKMIACTMSMDVMGIRPEELIDGLEFAGVATYLGEAEEANVNLFI
ncbi:MAG: DsrE/DsrF/DrsH-like family protein [Bacillota bacterium]